MLCSGHLISHFLQAPRPITLVMGQHASVRKLRSLADLEALGQAHRRDNQAVVLCHGCFDIVHPGHLRYLRFAREQGDVLVVSITGDAAIEKSDGTRPLVPQELRAEGLAAIEFVDHVAIVEDPTAEPVITALRPEVYVKGKEYEQSSHPGFLSEKRLVESFGGRVVHSSGEVVFSSTALIDRLKAEDTLGPLDRLATCCRRWGVDHLRLTERLQRFQGRRVLVVGDALLDRYVFCDASGVSGEAPMLSVRPMEEVNYLGGAAVIAAHLRGLGARPHLVTAIGQDPNSGALLQQLEQQGIAVTTFPLHDTLPMKQRYLVDQQKLLKVDHVHPRPLDSRLQARVVEALEGLGDTAEAAIFADFGCGFLTTPLLQAATPRLRPKVQVLAGDVSGQRQTLLAYQDFDLLSPTERELRGVMGDFEQSLPTLAARLMQRLRVGQMAVTMGPRGCVLFSPREADRAEWFRSRLRSEHIPALSDLARDPLGAGDAFLATATLARLTGASLPEVGYFGSLAGALQTQAIGNPPLTQAGLLTALRARPELRVAAGETPAAIPA